MDGGYQRLGGTRRQSAIVQAALQGATDGGVILMHDGGGNRSQTVAALDNIIVGLQAQGYKLVTLNNIPVLPIDFDGGTAPNHHVAQLGQAIASLSPSGGATSTSPVAELPIQAAASDNSNRLKPYL